VNPRVLITAEELRGGVRRLAAEISAAYPDGVLLVAVLKGSVLFLADLVRALTVPSEIDFLAISHYTEGTGRVRIVKDLDTDICDRDVVLVEDIVDTGLTLTYILGELGRRQPRRLRTRLRAALPQPRLRDRRGSFGAQRGPGCACGWPLRRVGLAHGGDAAGRRQGRSPVEHAGCAAPGD
jgi:hypoxanthine phosphoribosyltransferase